MGLEGWFPPPLRFGLLSIRYLMRAPIAAAAVPRIKPSVMSLVIFSTLRLILLYFPRFLFFSALCSAFCDPSPENGFRRQGNLLVIVKTGPIYARSFDVHIKARFFLRATGLEPARLPNGS